MGWKLRNKISYYYTRFLKVNSFVDLYLGGGARGAACERFFDELREQKRQAKLAPDGKPGLTAENSTA